MNISRKYKRLMYSTSRISLCRPRGSPWDSPGPGSKNLIQSKYVKMMYMKLDKIRLKELNLLHTGIRITKE